MPQQDPNDDDSQPLRTPLAVVGMACCLPGAGNLTDFWDFLCRGGDAIRPLPPERLDAELYFDPQPGVRGKTYSRIGGLVPVRPLQFLDEVLPQSEYRRADVCHQILTDVVLEACRQGRTDIKQFPWPNTGVYIGHSGGSTLGGDLAFRSLADEALDYLFDLPDFSAIGAERASAVVRDTANRLRSRRPERDERGGPDVEAGYASALIARALRLTGPHFVIDAACASSLVALMAAALALQAGEIDAAIVGGASFNKCDSLILFSHARSCSAHGSQPFDERADGLISSEGYAALMIKLLPRAMADGDPIQAVIRGLGMSSDGRGRSLWAPRKEGQIAAVSRAYGSGVDRKGVQFIEAHATSTQVGDATELEALASFFGPRSADRRIALGSVKSNIGHTLETAGLAGLIKAILAVQHGQIPPTINFAQPNTQVAWDQLPFFIPTQLTPWPEVAPDQPRCAAVNAFGIGGLNVHVVVESFDSQGNSPASLPDRERVRPTPQFGAPRRESCPLAVIGRGVVLPGAHSMPAFAELLRSGRSYLCDPPESRWRTVRGVADNGDSRLASRAQGGYLVDYVYDWRTHKIPPKQIAHANPLQFLLLDAAHAALVESGYDRRELDRKHTAVVVGTIFGGEFGNQLQVGLRLPEIRESLAIELARQGLEPRWIAQLLDRYEQRLLQAKPALLDETGSFTSSTLASRIAKTNNWMGGAMAVDAGECSAFAALSLACHLLQSRTCSTVLCAAAQRSLDSPAFQLLALRGLLATAEPDRDPVFPGEGVVAVLLKRLDDAQRDGDPILTVINDIRGGMSGSRSNFDQQQSCHFRTDCDESPLIRQVGHTQAAQGLVELLRYSVTSPHETRTITTRARSGLELRVTVNEIERRIDAPSIFVPEATAQGCSENRTTVELPVEAPGTPAIYRWSAATFGDLIDRRRAGRPRVAFGDPTHNVRMAIVANSSEALSAKMALVERTRLEPAQRAMLAEQGVYCSDRSRSSQPRIALAFPGQGSVYPNMLRSLSDGSPAAQTALAELDGELRQLGHDTVAELLGSEPGNVPSVWRAQIAMLLADYLALASVRELGVDADCVFGHSYGEFAALVAADSLTLREAIRLTHGRAAAIESTIADRGEMLSLNASPATIEPLLKRVEGRVVLSHHNAPDQVVVGGSAAAIAEFVAMARQSGITTRRLAVPAALHTELMQPARGPWRDVLRQASIRPPRVPLLSSISNKYVADPEEIRDNLDRQLVTPVGYVDLVLRLAASGIDAIVEVGPQQVLTRLHRRILEGRDTVALAVDHLSRASGEQRLRVRAELECLGWQPAGSGQRHQWVPSPVRVRHDIEHFDATAVRRRRRKSGAESAPTRPPSSPAAAGPFDAETTVLIDFVVEHTGYPADLIDLDWDLEADLGIDSIKRAQLFGELRQLYQLDTIELQSLDDYRTLRQIASLLRSTVTLPGTRPAPAIGSSGTAGRLRVPIGSAEVAAPTPAPVLTADGSELEPFLIGFVVDQTGYPAEVVDLDADFEADLGLDSIKKSQLLGELREHFRGRISEQASFAADDFRTLRQVADWARTLLSQPLDNAPRMPCGRTTAEFPAAERVTEAKPLDSTRFEWGVERGRKHAAAIQAGLRDVADQATGGASAQSSHPVDGSTMSHGDWSELCGLAAGAGIHVDNLVGYQRQPKTGSSADVAMRIPSGPPTNDAGTLPAASGSAIAHRYVLRMVNAPRQIAPQGVPDWHGAAVIFGDNELGQVIRRRIEREGQRAYVVRPSPDPAVAVRELERIWRIQPVPHLFLVTPRDLSARTTWDAASFADRRKLGVSSVFWLCQRWFQLVHENHLMDAASIVGTTALGGDFGFQRSVTSVESGALTGLLKSIIIESWVAGFRTIPVKLIDAEYDVSVDDLVDAIWSELSVPSYDAEIGIRGGQRWVVRALRQDQTTLQRRSVPHGGNWICTGGARGITAYVARELAQRYGLKLHLIGLAPPPQVPAEWRGLAADQRKRLKLEVMQSARSAGQNAIRAWETIEKSLEVDRNLSAMRELGIRAEYHSCDVADATALARVLTEIRATWGPIDGILHGAGVGKDARFDRKEPQRVEECLRAKVDGARALMELTRDDPLRYFVGFGSISGRFGANGHTDYSLANDMLCKLIDWFRAQRPEVKSIGFHWHAWGDVGMATKPETQLALEMVGMQFMPAAEGVAHLIGELESESDETEILITDDRYYRLFYPAETLADASSASSNGHAAHGALLQSSAVHSESGVWTAAVELDPHREPFLREHRLDDRPILPIVVATELFSEAAALYSSRTGRFGLRHLEAIQGLRFHSDRAIEVRVRLKEVAPERLQAELLADFRTRDGRVIETNRCYLRGEIDLSGSAELDGGRRAGNGKIDMQPVAYPARGSKMYLGHPLQCLRGMHVAGDSAQGRVVAPALVELAGPHRPVDGWLIPSAALDACLFATGLLCWSHVAPGPTLPVRFEKLDFGRLPQPGERCLVETRFVRRDQRSAVFEFTLFGGDGSPLIKAADYHVAWIPS